MLDVTDLSDGGVALFIDAAKFPGSHLKKGISTFTVAQDGLRSGTANDLPTLARGQFHVVEGKSERDRLERKSIADIGLGTGTCGNLGTHNKTCGMEDISLLTVSILDQSKTGGAVGIVFNSHDLSDRITATTLEINDTEPALVTTTAVTGSLAAHIIAATSALLALGKGFLGLALGDLLKGRQRLEPL